MPQNRGTIRAILLLTIARIIVNITRRFAYPFLPTISKELSVSLTSAQTVVATQAGIGITSPLVGPFSDQVGRKRTIVLCLSALAMLALIGFFHPVFWVFAVAMIGFGVVKMLYDPTMQAYIADRVPYRQRGLALGVTELSWAASLIIAAPVAGWLLADYGLSAIFLALAVVSGGVTLLIWRGLEGDSPDEGVKFKRITPLEAWRTLSTNPAALGAIGYSMTLVMANEILLISYGAWMERSFDLAVTALGLVTIVIAVAEVVGELSIIRLVDTIGKRRMALGGAFFSSILYLILPNLTFSLVITLVGLFILFVFVEIAIVASIPLFTEILPHARAVMMSSNVAAHSLGRLLGGLLGGIIYGLADDFRLSGIAALIIGLLAVFCLYRFVPELVDN